MAGRFKILTDEHWSKAHVTAARQAGWDAVRVVDIPDLGQGTLDPEVLESGRTLPGVIMAVQRHRITPGRLVRFLEGLAAEDEPFAGILRFVAPAD